jgi:hypothetical protein
MTVTWQQWRAVYADHLAAGAGALSVIAWEIARLSLEPVVQAQHSGALAHLDDGNLNRLKVTAAAQVAVIADVPDELPADDRRQLIERTGLAAPLLSLYGLLLRDRRDPSALASTELSELAGELLEVIHARIARAARSAAHSQGALDVQMRAVVETAGRLARDITSVDRATLPADGAPALPDFMALGQALMDQGDLRARWVTPWQIPAGAGQPSMGIGTPRDMTVAEALATLEASEQTTLSPAHVARQLDELLETLPGCQVSGYDGPRLRWLALTAAVERLAAPDAPSIMPPATATTATFVAQRAGHVTGTTAPMVASSPGTTGSRVGPYEIEAEIGRGGMGVVHRATDTVLNRTVALKLLHPGRLAAPDARARFRREVELAARVEHASIVTVFAAAVDSAVPYIVMRLVDGPSLADLLAKGPLNPVRGHRLFHQLASGLSALHAVGIVHRDVKPANVLIEHAGSADERDPDRLRDRATARRRRSHPRRAGRGHPRIPGSRGQSGWARDGPERPVLARVRRATSADRRPVARGRDGRRFNGPAAGVASARPVAVARAALPERRRLCAKRAASQQGGNTNPTPPAVAARSARGAGAWTQWRPAGQRPSQSASDVTATTVRQPRTTGPAGDDD